jgi:NTP pyrophosphatase (non-canonical NTP hydrolase)
MDKYLFLILMEIKEFQNLMKLLYFHRDEKRGIDKTLLWLIEEVGELCEAVRKEDDETIKEEIADIIAWSVSLANIFGIDVDKALQEKYPGRCRYCGKIPCACFAP